jgi:predicted kinase
MNSMSSSKLIAAGPCFVVFAGPPGSGKSYLSERAVEMLRNAELFAMDEIRKEILPGPINDEEARTAAYRVMHFRAGLAVFGAKTAILDATYFPVEARRELGEIARRLRVPLYVIQCWASPEEAVKRFRTRDKDHAGADLISSRAARVNDFETLRHGV